MRSRPYALAAGAVWVLLLTGCSTGPDETAQTLAAPPVQSADMPAAAAGGACILWDYGFLEQQLGVLFDVAAADQAGNTSTCVVQSAGSERPDLSLSVVEHTDADAALFTADLQPAKATAVKKLGKAAYRLVTKASAGHGPIIEVGWLSADKQVMTLRFTFAFGASATDAEKMAGRMISLARNLNGDTA